MQYRILGRSGTRVSALGFGCMRLPTLETHEVIDEPEATRMLEYALEHGVNYFDTAYGYHGGNSERFLGRFLQGRRDRVVLATKLWLPAAQTPEDFDRLFNEQLARLKTDHLDCYLLHGLRRERWLAAYNLSVLDFLDQKRREGRIRLAGFSFHDTFETFREIVDAFDWDMCQIQYNYMNEEYQAGTRGLQYAAAKGMGVVVMEPLLGGRLVTPPPPVQEVWDTAPVRRTPADWALQWLWNQPEVSVVLSGMSTLQQVIENVASAERSGVGTLTPEEMETIHRARDRYRSLCPIPCTACRYCMPCPNGVDIPENFSTFNNAIMFNQIEQTRRQYARFFAQERRASACIQCRTCEPKCPQNIPISEWMVIVRGVLEEGQPYDPQACPRP